MKGRSSRRSPAPAPANSRTRRSRRGLRGSRGASGYPKKRIEFFVRDALLNAKAGRCGRAIQGMGAALAYAEDISAATVARVKKRLKPGATLCEARRKPRRG